ncbi:LysE family translocator [Sphingomicrobium sediminis]|uniref:LysE family translocator n=1 Tax=Sphingomicrobium sediminis TaxID=2950949 RepID=A0A9X2EIV4_9SPHN|nr:LysE family translocator [Sphingomicrobium sediminis]MCM8557611.1 LysE family translocator [Sphingomicrobium sediminis]
MELSTFMLFAATTLVVVLTPGPAAIAAAAQASSNGVARTQATVAGIASANAAFFVLSATGISATIIASESIFTAIKWFGVAYLTYLGLSAIFSRTGGLQVERGEVGSLSALFGKGFLVEAANPKALLYFAAILPQFLDTSAPILPQMVIMGLVTLVFDWIVYSGYAVLGAQIASRGVRPSVVRRSTNLPAAHCSTRHSASPRWPSSLADPTMRVRDYSHSIVPGGLLV